MEFVIATTFREFKNNDNDNIQIRFLESIQNQSLNSVHLVVTTFNEKNVESFIKSNHNDIKSFFYHSNLKSHRYSHTEVLLNAINYSQKFQRAIMIWTTCDVIFENNFLENIAVKYSQDFWGTSHPHHIYNSIQYFNKRQLQGTPRINEGIDTIFFDSSRFRDKKIIQQLIKYKFYDWGVFEHFLIGIGVKFFKNGINIYNSVKINKIVNNRTLTNESIEFLSNSHKQNSITFRDYLKENSLSKSFFDLEYCNKKLKIEGSSLKYIIRFRFIGIMIKVKIPDILKKITINLISKVKM